MTRRNVEIRLQVEVDEDWVRGSAATEGGAPRPFYGWIGLVGVIEELTRESTPQPEPGRVRLQADGG